MLIEPPEIVLLAGPPEVLKVPVVTTTGDLTTVTAAAFARVTDPAGTERHAGWTGTFDFVATDALTGTLTYHLLGSEIDLVGLWYVTPVLTVPGGSVKAPAVAFRGVR